MRVRSLTHFSHMTPQSLVFVTPLPAYVYQNVAFEAVVKLVDGNKTTITGYVCLHSV